MRISRISDKQWQAFSWWFSDNGRGRDAIICDGAVRSGKTLFLSLSFAVWAMTMFSNGAFAFCGKTLSALTRNVITPLLPMLKELGYTAELCQSRNRLVIRHGSTENLFYLFSGKDEGSAPLIQGVTLSGVLFDEVALMPRSFVEQALARCSVAGSRFFFNCNPEFPAHWFYREWIQRCDEKNALYLHFAMRDNPSLTDELLHRYETMYSGAFYRRFVLGEWVSVSGAVYPFMDDSSMFPPVPDVLFQSYCVSCDYGTVNPASFGLWGSYSGVWYRISEYYYDARREYQSRTDEEHYEGLVRLVGDREVEAVIVDPSAASFIEVINRHGRFSAVKADNNVLDGIRRTSSALKDGEIVICNTCEDAIREFSLYRFDENSSHDSVLKKNDHAMDDIRYFVTYMFGRDDDFCCLSADRSKEEI